MRRSAIQAVRSHAGDVQPDFVLTNAWMPGATTHVARSLCLAPIGLVHHGAALRATRARTKQYATNRTRVAWQYGNPMPVDRRPAQSRESGTIRLVALTFATAAVLMMPNCAPHIPQHTFKSPPPPRPAPRLRVTPPIDESLGVRAVPVPRDRLRSYAAAVAGKMADTPDVQFRHLKVVRNAGSQEGLCGELNLAKTDGAYSGFMAFYAAVSPTVGGAQAAAVLLESEAGFEAVRRRCGD